MKKVLALIIPLFMAQNLSAQENIGYQKPPESILKLADYQRPPSSILVKKKKKLFLIYRPTYKSIKEVRALELRLGGLRINPAINDESRNSYATDIKIKAIESKNPQIIKGLPKNPQLSSFSLSPDEQYLIFTHVGEKGLEGWIIDIEQQEARKLNDLVLNGNMGNPLSWAPNGAFIMAEAIPKGEIQLINKQESVPTGPIISQSEGEKAQNRTYQDLLKDKIDEENFKKLTTSELYKVEVSGKATLWKSAAMHLQTLISPDAQWILVVEMRPPFSYMVPYYRFPKELSLYRADGQFFKKIIEKPLLESLPKGFMATESQERSYSWRSDQPATLTWVKALDGGDPSKKVEFRDEVFQSKAPFNQVESLFKTKNRYQGTVWGDEEHAIVYDQWFDNRNQKIYQFNPQTKQTKILYDRNYQDIYHDPGNFVTEKNKYNRYVLDIKEGKALLIGEGYAPKGQFPFIDEINLNTLDKNRIYQSKTAKEKESIGGVIDRKKGEILISLQSPTKYPNSYIKKIKSNDAYPITFNESPFKDIESIHKEVVHYKRADGIELSGKLYLPADYQPGQRLPLFLWAYPEEYTDKATAGQSDKNPNEFVFPHYGSPIYWVTRGFAVLDDASFPILGENGQEPNDTFITQLVDNAKAAIDYLNKRGIIDPERVAVGGHSYGAFMTANLLTHSNLFAAGIARSGAYNRTLTPFGFQSEQRNYWEAPKVYNDMSPFQNADKMKTPLLLIHGNDDNNAGTFTMQSERYFNALKGLGAPARLVLLPKEMHGYAAKESILHVLWEQDQWLEKYVKNKKTKYNPQPKASKK